MSFHPTQDWWMPDASIALPRRRRWPRLVGALVVPVLITVGVVGGVFGSEPGSAFPPNQAGYVYCCTLHQLAARWSVPVSAPGATGDYSLWVGAQDEAATSLVQVGTTNAVSGGDDEAEAFWSDTAVDYHPVFIGVVQPGDAVRVSIRFLGHGAVALAFVDVTTSWSRTVRLTSIPPQTSQSGEFIQEDPGITVDGRNGLEPFARVLAAGMSHLTVDDRAPGGIVLQPEAVTIRGVTYAPSAIRDDGFTWRPW